MERGYACGCKTWLPNLTIQQEKNIVIVRWIKPMGHGMKLNTDGASKGSTGLAGAGGTWSLFFAIQNLLCDGYGQNDRELEINGSKWGVLISAAAANSLAANERKPTADHPLCTTAAALAAINLFRRSSNRRIRTGSLSDRNSYLYLNCRSNEHNFAGHGGDIAAVVYEPVVDNTVEVNGNEKTDIGMVVIRGNSVVTIEALRQGHANLLYIVPSQHKLTKPKKMELGLAKQSN
ncbi:UNVERIFIED_CONTAM: putative small nuclear ribonucleoprotein G [Sesamum calycinum]|uniref:Small nuclear ribonucleoprotein G n=1 Tax=Sesamum calycinum TaxID=2727403 RepID=A0AAW2QKA9_9LAMI